MEMTFNKENSASLSQLMATVSAMNTQKLPAKQPIGKDQMQAVTTDFSERLSAALDEPTTRGETAGKVTVKKGPEKDLPQASEAATTAIPFGVVPASPETNNVQSTVGTELLVDLKNAALQGIAAGVATVLPLVAQAVVPAVVNSPVLSELVGGVGNAVTDLFTADKSNPPKAQNLQQTEGMAATNAIQTGSVAINAKQVGAMPNLSTNSPVAPVQIDLELPATKPPVNSVVSTDIAPVNVPANSPGVAADSTQLPAVNQSPGQPVNAQAVAVSQPVANPETLIQQQIQQDMRGAKVSVAPTMPIDSLASLNQAGKPVLVNPTESADTENATPLLEVSQPAVETVVKTSTEQELPKRSMAESGADLEAGLSEKKDASLTAPVGFDKVMASVNEPAVVTPPVAQPRPDLHEVVKQVMDGMISPSQQLKSSQVIITLKPEHLGEVTVKINVDGDKVTAAFHAASSEVRGILESSLPQLKQEMSQQGWQFDSDGVFGGMQEFLAQQQQQQQQTQQQQMRSMINHARPDEYDDAMAFSSSGKLQVMSATAVDYRV